MTNYRHAPVTEAVLDFHLKGGLSARDMERVRDKFKRLYPAVNERLNFEVEIKGKIPHARTEVAGYQMTAENGVDVLLLHEQNITTSRLAPYSDWDSFIALAKRNFEGLVDVVDRPKVERISTRYINRLDVPDDLIVGKDLNVFFAGGIQLPPTLAQSSSQFSLNIKLQEKETGLLTSLSLASAPSALLEHQSFLLDIDVHWIDDIPLNFEKMWIEIDMLRRAKNNIFECMLTDEAKALIS